MIARILRELLIFTKHIVIFAFFLALTFVILEYVKAFERGDKFKMAEVVIELPGEEQSQEYQNLNAFESFIDDSQMFLGEKDVPDVITLSEEPEIISEKEDQAEYDLYEEELPHDIVLDVLPVEKQEVLSSKDGKDIKDIAIQVVKKPSHFEDAPVIAIVIDDMGISKRRTKDINQLNFPITSSFLTYGTALDSQVEDSIKAGHEVIAHIPMEASKNIDTAPDVLKVAMSDDEVIKSFNAMLNKFHGIKGINNHMGSKFTESETKMEIVMKILKERDLFFLDSRTSNKSVGKTVANKFDVKYVNRNIFLDNVNEYNYIMGQLEASEKVARKKGYAIAIGHPKSQTYLALKDWLPKASQKGFKLVHLSEIVDVLNK
ncbi:MAG: divergent polysaccharide deacetylase family protein [Alphaproteobacteria bacterium]